MRKMGARRSQRYLKMDEKCNPKGNPGRGRQRHTLRASFVERFGRPKQLKKVYKNHHKFDPPSMKKMRDRRSRREHKMEPKWIPKHDKQTIQTRYRNLLGKGSWTDLKITCFCMRKTLQSMVRSSKIMVLRVQVKYHESEPKCIPKYR